MTILLAAILLAGTLFQHSGISLASAHCTNAANKHYNFQRNFTRTYTMAAEKTLATHMRKGHNARYVFNFTCFRNNLCGVEECVLCYCEVWLAKTKFFWRLQKGKNEIRCIFLRYMVYRTSVKLCKTEKTWCTSGLQINLNWMWEFWNRYTFASDDVAYACK